MKLEGEMYVNVQTGGGEKAARTDHHTPTSAHVNAQLFGGRRTVSSEAFWDEMTEVTHLDLRRDRDNGDGSGCNPCAAPP